MDYKERTFAKLKRASIDARLLKKREIIDLSIMQNKLKSEITMFSMLFITNLVTWRTLLPKLGQRVTRKSK